MEKNSISQLEEKKKSKGIYSKHIHAGVDAASVGVNVTPVDTQM